MGRDGVEGGTGRVTRATSPGATERLGPAFPRPGAATPEGDLSKVRHKLRKFLLKRPTLQSLREKGYIKGTGRGRRAGTGRLGGGNRAALTGLSPRPGVRLRAGRAV